MLTPEMQNLITRYPNAGKLAELAAHHEENTPVYIICEYLLNLTNDILAETVLPQTDDMTS